LDGPKGQYIRYLPVLTNLLNVGGVIFADNVLYKGMVESTEFIPHKKRTIVVNLRKYLNEVTNSDRFDTIVHKIGDGVAISKLIK
jgi:caffeoyl-CoA O-methyltransferase